MKKFLISEEEKNRILGMHKEATKKHYLSEQATPKTPTGLNPSEAKAVNMIQDKIERGEKTPVVILPENPTVAYQYPYDVKPGEQPYWANGLFVYVAQPGRVADPNKPGSTTIPPYGGHFKTVSSGTDNKWTSETYALTSPRPVDAMNLESVVGRDNFVSMIKAAFNKLDENSKNVIKQYVANSKEYPAEYKQIIATA